MPAVRANLGELLDTSLPVALRHIPQRIRDVAESLNVRVALVGGMPRDLLRIRVGQLELDAWRESLTGGTTPATDFDIVVEGDAIAFAYELVRRLPGKLT
ncbi:MAG: hypothetical protein M3R04_06825, partial [bacterium]|nr:hypothetical protein [bacterium]